MKRISFKFKLILLCIFLCGVGAIIGSISYIGTTDLIEIEKTITKDLIPKTELIGKLDSSYQKVRIEVRTLGLMNLPIEAKDQAIEDTKAAVERYEKYSGQLKERVLNPSEKEVFLKLEQEWLNFKAIGLRAIELGAIYDEKAKEGLATIFAVDCPRAASIYQTALSNYINFVETEVRTASADAEIVANKVNLTNLGVSIVGILLGLFAGIFLASRISAAIELISEKLTLAVKQLKESSEASTASSHSLSEASIEQAASVQETSASLEEISSMVEVTAKNASQSKDLVETSLDEVSKGKNTIGQMIHSIDTIDKSTSEIMSQVDQNNEKMNEIVGLISQIESKTKVINDIVFQTKLLSFNASVEAARAGESGKGFAVVAEEVGNLAAMSGKAADEIASMLSNSIGEVNKIVSETKTSVQKYMGAAKEKIEVGINTAHACVGAFEGIVGDMNQVSQMVEEITNASKEQTVGVGEITRAMDDLDVVTMKGRSLVDKNASLSTTLRDKIGALDESVLGLRLLVGEDREIESVSKTRVVAVERKNKPAIKMKEVQSLESAVEEKTKGPVNIPDSADSRFIEL